MALVMLGLVSILASAAEMPQVAGFQGGGALLGQAEAIHAPPMKVRWTYRTDEVDRAGVEGSAVIAGQTAYVADSKGNLHAIDLGTGKSRWVYKTGDSFATTPLVVEGRVFLGDMTGVFHAVSADDGRKLWTVETEATIHASANIAGARIIFANDASDIFCLNAADGKVLWKGKGGDRINSAPAVGGGLAYFTGCDAQLRGFDLSSGQEKLAADMQAMSGGSPVLLQDRLIVATDQGRVLAVSLDGKKTLWTYAQVVEEAMVYATPAAAEGVVVVGARDRQVHAIDLETGKRKWTFKTRGDVDASAVISDGRVYVGSQDKKLYVLDLKTGRMIWKFNAGRSIDGAAAIGSGVVVVADSAGNVYCLE
jgi:outer membrane protein assembly factor BamB